MPKQIVKSLSVFFPCYNEQDNVERVVNRSIEILEPLDIDYELIIVNDGSKDRTSQIAHKLAEANSKIKVVDHPTNLGYGAALQSGFRAATKEFVFYTDGDGQFDIAELPPLFDLMNDCDIVSCCRINRQDNFIRKLNAFCWTTLVCMLFKMKLKDIDCAFKLYRRNIFDNMQMKSTGALIDTEILARAVKKGCRIVQRPVHHYPRTAGRQTGAKISVILRAFKELFGLYRQIKKS